MKSSISIYLVIPVLFLLTLLCLMSACRTSPHGPIRTESSVDINRFMGDWYVIAVIPTFVEKNVFNAIESYALEEGSRVATTFSFNKGGFDGPRKVYTPTGFIRDDPSNAIWGMQFIWPIKAEYRIVFVDEDYSQTIIGRSKRDYVWIMARTPQIAEADYQNLLQMVEDQGYDTNLIVRVPQQPIEQR